MTTQLDNTSLPATTTGDGGRRFHWSVRTLIAMVTMFLFQIPGIVLPMLLPKPDPAAGYSLGNVLIWLSVPVAMGACGVLLAWLWIRVIDRRPYRQTGITFTWTSIPWYLAGALLDIVVCAAVSYPLKAAGLMTGDPMPMQQSLAIGILGVFIGGTLAQGLPEEATFRGYLQQSLAPRTTWFVCLVSAAAFGILHLLSSGGQENVAERFLYLVQPFGFGFLAAALVIVTRNLWVAVGVHGGNHFWGDLIAPLTGIPGRPAAWVATGIAQFAVGVALLVWHQRKTGQRTVPDPLYP